MNDFEKLLELLGIKKLSPEKQKLARSILKKIIANYQSEKSEGTLMEKFFQVMSIDHLDEEAQGEIRAHTWKCIKSKAGYHSVDEYDFSFGGGFSNSLKKTLKESMFKPDLRETTATGSEISGPDSPKIGDLYTRKKDAQGIFRQSPMPKKQDKVAKKNAKQLQKIKDLFQSRNIKDVSIADIEKILSESSPTTSTFSHNAWSGFKYVRLTRTGTVSATNSHLVQVGSTINKEKQDELEAMGIKFYFSEGINEGKQNKNELIKALANLLEWAKGNRGSKSGNPYGFPEVKNALKVLGKIEGVNYLDVDTKKLSEAKLNEAYQGNDSLMDDLTYQELLDTVYSNIEDPDEKAVMREFEKLLTGKIKDARYEMRKALKQILKDVKE